MEFANNGDLYQRIVEQQRKNQLFPEAEIWSVFIQVVKGLKTLHDLKILHRDLKVTTYDYFRVRTYFSRRRTSPSWEI